MSGIIIFDGMCNLCNGSVQFIIKRDPNGHFKFASLQSETGERLINDYGIPRNSDSFILIEDGNWFQKSSAALRVSKHLSGGWKLLYPLTVIPTPIRDSLYEVVAKNRYKWFGKREYCMMPTPEMKNRFLD